MRENEAMLLGRRITQARERRGWDKVTLARRAGASPSYITRIEAGAYATPSIDRVGAIAEALGVALEALTGPPPVESPDDDTLLRKLIEKRLGSRANAALVEAIIERLKPYGPLDVEGTLTVLDVMLPRLSTDPHLFTVRGERISLSYLRLLWHRTIRVARLPTITPKDGRATCATILLDEGWSLPRVAALLGHASVATTSAFYARQLTRRRDQIERMGEELDSAFRTAADRDAEGAPAELRAAEQAE